MDNIILSIIVAIVVGVATGYVFIYFYKKTANGRASSLETDRQAILEEARKEAENIKKEAALAAKDMAIQIKTEAEREIRERAKEQHQIDKRLRQKEEQIDRRLDHIEKRENEINKRDRDLNNREALLSAKETNLKKLIDEQTRLLEQLSGITTEEAKAELLRRVEQESRFEVARLIKRIEDETRENAEKKAKEIISFAIQRYANDYVADATISAVSLPGDDMKGRIIGREGRNIRAFEAATGVDLVVDDTPELVTLSAHDPVRREVARLALERLISDGRIHPTRIEEVVEKVKKEVEATIREEGEKAVFELEVSGIHPELIKTIGRLKYRYSYGQNVLQHSKEVAYFAGMMAGELGVDIKLAKRAGLLHDIGKAVDHEVEGSHQEIGASLARKYHEKEAVINAILAHHGDVEVSCVESALVAASDALSAARPGVRRESIANYLKRLQKLEELAMSFNGVEKCYAIQAGREVRIIVKPEETADELCALISRDLARKIEAEMTYPGQIKVTVVRETRFVEYAK